MDAQETQEINSSGAQPPVTQHYAYEHFVNNHSTTTEPLVQVNYLLRIEMVLHAIDIELPLLLRWCTLGALQAAERLHTSRGVN